MVGHTGDFDATVRAVECVDACLGRIARAVDAAHGGLLITADHGNAEYKIDRRDGSMLTAHTTSPVPVILCGAGDGPLRDGGGLRDVAPTVLDAMGLPVPDEMTGTVAARPLTGAPATAWGTVAGRGRARSDRRDADRSAIRRPGRESA